MKTLHVNGKEVVIANILDFAFYEGEKSSYDIKTGDVRGRDHDPGLIITMTGGTTISCSGAEATRLRDVLTGIYS